MQFDVYRNLNPKTKQEIPYLVDLQANVLNQLSTRVVAPLILSKKFGKPAKFLHINFVIENKNVVMITNELAGVPVKILGDVVASLSHYRQEIIGALDFLFTGI